MRRSWTPKRWHILPETTPAEVLLQAELGVHPVVARLLVQRGLTTPEAADNFLHPSLDRLHDPFLLPDIEPACERLKKALHNQEKILVHGDYDGDGVTSAALWTRALRSLGGQVDVFVPHRARDGYDMRVPIIEQAKQEGISLIITTDCGIQRIEEVEHARQVGIDVIVTDHHTPNSNGELPKAVAVINPHRHDSRYPFPDLAGVGVAFKTCEALTRYLGHKPEAFRRGYLDLAAIGTVTDIMPMLDENRILVKYGLEALANTKKAGLRALIEVTGLNNGRPLNADSIGFVIGPHLNAAGRVDETKIALDLLLTKDEQEAERLARRLTELNGIRKEETTRIFEEAMAQAAQQDMSEARCLVLSGTGWGAGVIGIVANKIVERFHRPCIMIALDPATNAGRGSARSIRAFHILEAIDACRGLLGEYGGHSHAAGLSIEGSHIEDFASQMNRIARSLLTEEDLQPGLEVAMEVAPSAFCPELLQQIEDMAPFGSGNHAPLFVSRGVPIRDIRRIGAEKQHLKLRFQAEGMNGNDLVDGLLWQYGELAEHLEMGMPLDICYRPEFNHYNGYRSVQFKLSDLRPPEW